MSFITNYCIIRDRTIRDSSGVLFQKAGSTLNDFLVGGYEWTKAAYPKFYKMDSLSKLGFLAAEILLKNVNLKDHRESVALVLSNAHSSLDTDVKYFESAKTIASPALFVYTLPNIVSGEICIRHGIKGENAFFISEAFDPLTLSEYVEMVLSQSKTDICVAGWVDVMDEHHDVFLYLAENRESGNSPEHSVKILADLYK